MAKLQVDRLTLKTFLPNFRCILSISFDLEKPQISLEKPKIEHTNASNIWNNVKTTNFIVQMIQSFLTFLC